MSYPSLSGHGSSYYNTAPTNSKVPSGYNTGRQTSQAPAYSNQAAYQNDTSQQYNGMGYNWTAQNQTQNNGQERGQQMYGGDGYWDNSGQPSNYSNYQRQANDYATQAAAGDNSMKGYGPAAHATNTSDVQGLNSLAYASRLEPPAHAHSGARTYTSSTQTTAGAQNRVKSPVTTTQSYGHVSLPTPYNTQAPQSSGSEQSLALSAAAALAGATHRRYQTTPQPAPQKSTSPATTSASSNTAKDRYRTNSPQVAAGSGNHDRTASTQSRLSNTSNVAQNYAATNPTAYQQARKTGVANTASKVSRAQTKPQSVSNASAPPNSIANLVSNENEVHSTYSSDGDNQAQTPGFIDPTKVYDPYHKEREQRRRAAEEAEAKRQADEARAKREADEAKAKEEAQQQNSRRKALNAAGRKGASTATTSGPVGEMANEMKQMMEKMKEFRSKDPNLFQKLWDDMRKGGANSVAGPAPVNATPSPQISAQQPPPSVASASKPPASGSGSKPRRPDAVRPEVPDGIPANGYRVVVENNPEGLPDLGRFPAERRIRASYQKKSDLAVDQNIVVLPPTTSQPSTPAATVAPTPNIAPIRIPQTSLPPKTPKGGTMWPEEKRNVLATHALSFLKAIPENANVNVSSDDIHAMLDQNPSYADLCALLEKTGLRFQRAHFARHLLNNVPDLNSKGAKAEPQSATLPPNENHVNGNVLNGMQGAASSTTPSMPTPQFAALKTETPLGKGSKSKQSSMFSKSAPAPGSKEALSRKRDFAELVDLTQLDDNDDYVTANKHSRLESYGPGGDPLYAFQFAGQPSPQAHAPDYLGLATHPYGYPPPGVGWGGVPGVTNPPHGPVKPGREKVILAKAMSKEEADKKTYYDPRTLARDILIAAGKHPIERPLNAHLSGMLGVHIEYDSDLNTFDWDAVDPGGPPAPKVPFVDVPTAPPKLKYGERVNTQAVQNGRHPEKEKRANNHSAPAPGGPETSLSRAAQNAIDNIKKLTEAFEKPWEPGKPLRFPQDVNDNKVTSNTSQKRTATSSSVEVRSRESATRSISQSQDQRSTPTSMDGKTFPSGSRRGRPPGSKNKHPSQRKEAHPGGLVVEIPRKASPPAAMTSTPSKSPFKCRWRNCDAHLDNLVLLRRHVQKVHAPSAKEVEESGGFVCWWKKCPLLKLNDQGDFYADEPFSTSAAWFEHVNQEHIVPIGLKYGDGPSTKPINAQTLARDRTRFLSDDTGRAVTPAINREDIDDLPMDTLSLISAKAEEAERIAHKSFLKAHRNNRTDDKASAEETMKAMEARRAKMPGIDRQGCTLVNEERRKTFMQNPGIARVVDY